MTTVLKDIIDQLEREQGAINKALVALREVAGIDGTRAATEPKNGKVRERRKISAAARKKMSDAQKRRWASTRVAKSSPRKAA
jgi:hypothetical protein